MAIKYDENAINDVINIADESLETLNDGVGSSIMNDFSAFSELGLFSSQLNTINGLIDELKGSNEELIAILSNHKSDWVNTEQNVKEAIVNYGGETYGNTSSNSLGASLDKSKYKRSDQTNPVNKSKKVSNKEVKDFVTQLDNSTVSILLKKIYSSSDKDSIVDLLIDQKKANILVKKIKKILKDDYDDSDDNLDDDFSNNIQTTVLGKVNNGKTDIKTPDDQTDLKTTVLTKVKAKTEPADQVKWNDQVYGTGKIKKVSLLGGVWNVVDTKMDLNTYASYIASAGVRQNSDTKKYSDYCLAFSYVHAYDLYNGTKGTAVMAGNYAHASAFEDYYSDDKSKVLQKVYSEIMSGRPVILQVNGNTAGTSRHFVTVVGLKTSVTDPSQITEDDLLIIDSWDGKIERMDTDTSRFMTTGAQCHKEYSGYRLRVLKTDAS